MKNILLFLLCLSFLAFHSGEDKTSIFLIGDSTMANKLPTDAPETGWGMVLQQYFTNAVEVQNHAVNGRSTKSFRSEGRWGKVLEQMRPGDWVLIQFGHNDQKNTDTTRYAAPQTDYRLTTRQFWLVLLPGHCSLCRVKVTVWHHWKESITSMVFWKKYMACMIKPGSSNTWNTME